MMDPNNLEQGGYPPPAETVQAPQAKDKAKSTLTLPPSKPPVLPVRPCRKPRLIPKRPLPRPSLTTLPAITGPRQCRTTPILIRTPITANRRLYPPPPPYSQQPPYPQQPVNPQPNAKPQYKPEGLAVAAMVLGICSVVMGSLVCAILALVFSSRVKGHYPNGNLGPNTTYVKVGKICGAVGLGISIFAIVLIIVCLILLVTNGTIDYLYNYPYYLNY